MARLGRSFPIHAHDAAFNIILQPLYVGVAETTGLVEALIIDIYSGTDVQVVAQDRAETSETVAVNTFKITVSDSTTLTDSINAVCSVFKYYRKITVDHTQTGSTDSTNFPLLVSGTLADLATVANGGTVQNANGYDIGFYSDINQTTKLNWETELYTAATGQFIYWVQVPTLKSTAGGNTTDTTIYLFYSDPTVVTDLSNKSATYDSNYKGVWHFDDNAASTTVAESTGNSNAVGTANTNTSVVSSSGNISTGFIYDRSQADRYTTITGTLLTSASAYTISWWENIIADVDNYCSRFILQQSNGTHYLIFRSNNSPYNVISFGPDPISNSMQATGAPSIASSVGVWRYFCITGTDPNDNTVANHTAYVDGVAYTTTLGVGAVFSTVSQNRIGADGVDSRPNATMDEPRVSSGVRRSADWILAEYNNQKSGSSMVTIGTETSLISVYDATVLTDSIGGVLISNAPVSDVSVLADNVQLTLVSNVNKSDTSALSDNVQLLLVSNLAVSEVTALTDTPVLLVTSFAAPADTTALSDNVQVLLTSFITTSDNTALAESVTLLITSFIATSDTTPLAESNQLLLTSNLSVNDTSALTDNVQLLLTSFVSVTDTTALTDTPTVLIPELNVSVSDTTALSDSVQLLLTSVIAASDSTALSDSVTLLLQSFVATSDSTALSDNVQLLLTSFIAASDSTALADAGSMLTTSFIATSDLTVLSETTNQTLQVLVAASDSTTLSDNVQVLLVGNLSVSDLTALFDSPAVLIESAIKVFDTSVLAESVILSNFEFEVVSDTTILTDVTNLNLVSSVLVNDLSALAENVAITFNNSTDLFITLTDSLSTSDSATLLIDNFTITTNDTTIISDAIAVIILALAAQGFLEFFE